MRLPLSLLLLLTLSVSLLRAQEKALPTLTTARQLRELPPDEAKRKYPVRLRAVVTLVAAGDTIFLQDETGGTFLHVQLQKFSATPGQEVEVEGYTNPGLYVTGVNPTRMEVVGEAPLPVPRVLNYEQLASGSFNYEWVEVSGTVRAFRSDEEGHGVITLSMGGGRLEVLANVADEKSAARLIDDDVRVTGLAAGFINKQRQLVAPHLRVNDFSAFQVRQNAPEDPFSLPVTPATQLLQINSTTAAGHRVKVRGVVTYQEPGQALFLRDEEQGLLVEGSSPKLLRPGDVVEAAGFAEMGLFSAQLRDAVWQVLEHGPEPISVATGAKEILRGSHNADLVTLNADLVDLRQAPKELELSLRSGTVAFRARLSGPQAANLISLRPDSGLRLTGVVLVDQPEFPTMQFSAQPRSFTLLLRSAGDVKVLHQPPWWTPERLAMALAAVLAVAGMALVWAAALRRRVLVQTTVIREKVKLEAAAEERERIAREFHDTLEQELVGLALRLDAAAPKVTEPKPRELLDAARRLVQNIQAEARNLVRNLRARQLDEASLPEAITQAVAALGYERTIRVHTDGEPRPLPGLIEHELLRIAQEATTNAVKHGQASEIDIALGFSDDAVQLRVADNGLGFDPERDATKPGHFGLIGIRERVQKLDGQFNLRSSRGAGATLDVTVPLSPPSA